MKIFLPMKINNRISGDSDMDYRVERMNSFKVIGFERAFSFDTSYEEIPRFWGEYAQEYMCPLLQKDKPDNAIEETICNCKIGQFGICIDDLGQNKFRYLIAGIYTEGNVPEGMVTYEFKDMEWAKFTISMPIRGK